ncbi:MAG: tetratricopeptide repeat protein [Acidobacteriota bacterium]
MSSKGASSPRRSLSRRGLSLAFGLGLALALLVVLEGVLALAGLGGEEVGDDPFVGFAPGSDLFERVRDDDGRAWWSTRPAKLAFFNAQRFPVDKASGAYRVFTLGGSTTAGRPYDHHVAFAAWLERFLKAAEPQREWQVVNAGAISYASYRVALLMRELARYEPDLFVVYTGHNEFLEERSYADLRRANTSVQGFRSWLGRRRFATLLRRATSPKEAAEGDKITLGAEVETKLDGWTGLERYQRDEELERSVVAHLDANLDRMVALARQAGAEILFVDPVENLRDFSPFKSQPGPSVSEPEERRAFEQSMNRGFAALAADDRSAAEAAFEQAVALDPRFADAWFRLGRARFDEPPLDPTGEALVRRALLEAKDQDVAPLRALEAIHQQLAVGAERNGAGWIPLRRLIEEESRERFGHGLLGNEFLLDHVHPDLEVHARLAAEIQRWMADRGLVRDLPEDDRRAIVEAYVATIDREYYARRDLNLAKVLGWAGKLAEAEAPLQRAAAVLEDEPELHLNLGILYQKTGRLAAAMEQLQRAAELAPQRAEGWFNLGVTFGRLGRSDDAVQALEEAIRLRPQYAEAHQNLGVVLREAGRLEASRQALEQALALRPRAAEIYRSLALTHRRGEDWPAAEAALREALRLAPDFPALRTDLAVALARQGRLGEAGAVLDEAIETDPDDPEAWYNRGVLFAETGDRAAAKGAYEEAIAVDPGHAQALNNLGVILASEGRLQEASERLVAAIAAAPEFADPYFNLGIAYDQAGNPSEAIRAVERAVELSPGERRYRVALSLLYAATGRETEAREQRQVANRLATESL